MARQLTYAQLKNAAHVIDITGKMNSLVSNLAKEWQSSLYLTAAQHTLARGVSPRYHLVYQQQEQPVSQEIHDWLQVRWTDEVSWQVLDIQQTPLPACPDVKYIICFSLRASDNMKQPWIRIMLGFAERVTISDEVAASTGHLLQAIYQTGWHAFRHYRINQLAQRLDDTIEADQLFDILCDDIQQIIDISETFIFADYSYTYGEISLHISHNGQRRFQEAMTHEERAYWFTMPDKAFSSIDRYDDTHQPVLPPGMNPASFIFVPIRIRDELMGALLAAHSLPDRYDAETVELLSLIGSQLSINLHNSQMTESFFQVARLDDLIMRGRRQHLKADRLLTNLVETVLDIVQADNVSLHIYNRIQDKFTSHYTSGHLFDPQQAHREQAYERYSLVQLAHDRLDSVTFVREAETIYEKLNVQTPFARANFIEREKIQSVVISPLQVGDISLGMLFVNYRHRQNFASAQQLFLQTLVNHTATTLLNLQQMNEARKNFHQRLLALQDENGDGRVLDDVMRQAVNNVMDLLQPDDVALFLVNKQKDRLQVIHAAGKNARQREGMYLDIPDGQPHAHGLVRYAYLTRTTCDVPDTTRMSAELANHYHAMNKDTRSEMDIPLITTDDRILGVLSLESEQPAYFEEVDREFVQTLGQRICTLIENARNHDYLQRLDRSIDHMVTVAGQVNQAIVTNSLDDLYQMLLEGAAAITSTDAGNIMLLDPESNQLRIGAILGAVGLNNTDVNSFRQPMTDGVIGEAIQQGRPVNVGDVSSHPAYIAVNLGMQSELAAPMIDADGNIAGAINLESEKPYNFDEVDERIIQLFTSLALGIVTTSRQVQEIQQQQTRLKKYKARFRSLHTIEQIIIETDSADKVIQAVVDMALTATDSARCNFHRYRDGIVYQIYDRHRNDETARLIPSNIPIDDYGIIRKAIQSETGSFYAPDVREDRDYKPKARATGDTVLHALNTRSEFALALVDDNSIIGVLNVEHETPYYYSDDDLDIIQILGRQLALALRNHHLKERLNAIVEISQELNQLVTEDDLPQAYHIVADKMAMLRPDCQIYVRRYRNETLYTKIIVNERERPPRSVVSIRAQPHHHVYQQGQAIYLSDRENPPPDMQPLPTSQSGIRSQIVVPLMLPHDTSPFYGTLTIVHHLPRHFNENDLLLMQEMGRQLTTVIHRIESQIRQQDHYFMAYMGHHASSIIHEFKNKIIAAKAWYPLIEQSHYAETIRAQDAHLHLALTEMKSVLDNASQYMQEWETRYEAFTHEPQPAVIQLATLFDELTAPYRETSVKIEMDPLPESARTIYADHSEMRLAFANLIDNAIEAIQQVHPDGGGRLQIRAQQYINPRDRHMTWIQISDNGSGISREDAERIFTLFYTQKLSGTSAHKSWGLGLWSTRNYIQRNQGLVRLSNTPVDGMRTTFDVFLPAAGNDPQNQETSSV